MSVKYTGVLMAVAAGLPEYRFEHLFIDNASTDGTVAILREMAAEDPTVKVIVNARKLGRTARECMHFLQAREMPWERWPPTCRIPLNCSSR